MKPTKDHVLLEPIKKQEETYGIGIVIFKNNDGNYGYVRAIADNLEGQLEIGNRVLYADNAGTAAHFDNKDYLIVKMDEIYAVAE